MSRPWALAASMAGFVMLAIYVGTVASQGGPFLPAAPWALSMALGAVAALAGARLADQRRARIAIVGAAAIFVVVGVVSLLTIGIGFLLAAIATSIAADRLMREPDQAMHDSR